MPGDLDLGRRLVAAPGWRWAAGMRVLEPEYGWTALRLTGHDADYWHACAEDDRAPSGTTWYRVRHDQMHLRCPDLDDPAVAGVLLAELLAAAPESAIWWSPKSGGWCWRRLGQAFLSPPDVRGPTLGRAVAEALLSVRSA